MALLSSKIFIVYYTIVFNEIKEYKKTTPAVRYAGEVVTFRNSF